MLLKFAIDDFLSEKEYHNLSETSINSYMYTLLGFNNFCSEQQIIDTNDVKENTVKDFLKFCMKERDNNPTSISHKLRNLKAFFNYMVEEEIIGESPAKKIKPPKIDIKIEVYSDDDIKQMLNYYKRQHRREGTYLPFRNYMIIITFISTGIRLGELCNLEWSGVDLINDNMIVFGKKRQQSSVPITSKLKKELSQYHIYCQHVFDKMPKYVFVNAKGKKITENTIKSMFRKLKNALNYKGQLSAHVFRHKFAHDCLMKGCDQWTLQKLLRHETPAMVEKYLALWGTALKSQAEKYNPLNNMDFI